MNAEKKQAFLAELNKLSKKHQIYIGGCGCCNSPYLLDETEDYNGLKSIEWDKEKERYIEAKYSI